MFIAILQALKMAFLMGWEIFWALVLGLGLSAIVQAVVPKATMSRLLPDSSPKSLAIACGLGAASSSCSYAAVALTRAIIRKGADFIAAMGFQLASTNLVMELSILIILLLGWQFALAEFVGGLILVALMAILFREFVSAQFIQKAKEHADLNLMGKMEGHALMDMSVSEGPFFQRLFSKKGLTAISHYFIMDWAAIWKDIVLGLLIAGALAAWIPSDFWTTFFLQNHPAATKIWGPLIGPIVAMLSFVCSVGNVPLAAVLWNGGISFGGVVSFIFADLIVIPILHIYWKYYGFKMMTVIFIIYYVAMVLASLFIEFAFQFLHLIPTQRSAEIFEVSVQLNYTAILNLCFGMIAIILLYRFFKTGGMHMFKMMERHANKHG
ncbi:MAG: permease [Gammaproteobacteria bacterium]